MGAKGNHLVLGCVYKSRRTYQELAMLNVKESEQNHIQAQCPSCQQHALFERVGTQQWPAAVAEATGLPQVVVLFTCSECRSTVAHVDLMADED